MCFLTRGLLMGLFALAWLASALSSARAAVEERECAAIRANSARSNEQVFFQSRREFLPARGNERQLAELINGEPAIRFVYLARFAGDRSPTLMSSIIRFLISNPATAGAEYSQVFVFNNLKSPGFWLPFEEYQSFHLNQQSNHRLKERFHVAPGLFTRATRTLFDSAQWEFPRRFLAISGDHATGEGVFSYLIALKGLDPNGSCFDTSFVLPPSIRNLSFVVRNLRATQSGQYLNPVETSIRFPE